MNRIPQTAENQVLRALERKETIQQLEVHRDGEVLPSPTRHGQTPLRCQLYSRVLVEHRQEIH